MEDTGIFSGIPSNMYPIQRLPSEILVFLKSPPLTPPANTVSSRFIVWIEH